MKTLREEAIAQMVLNRLREDQRTCGQTIDVTVVDGDIFLVGYCDTEEQRLAAEMLARGAYGGKSVVDRIRVRRIVQSI